MNSVTNNSTAFILGNPALGTTLNAMDYVGEFRSTSFQSGPSDIRRASHSGGLRLDDGGMAHQPAVNNGFTGVNSNEGYIEFAYGISGSYHGIGLSGQGNTAPDMIVNGSGNVGIGTTTPLNLLSLANNSYIG